MKVEKREEKVQVLNIKNNLISRYNKRIKFVGYTKFRGYATSIIRNILVKISIYIIL